MSNGNNQYKFKFNIETKHKDSGKSISYHKWEIDLFTIKDSLAQTEFTEIENLAQQYIDKYSQRTINNIRPFDSFIPNIENLGYVLFIHLSDLLKDKGWGLNQIEIVQNQTRTFTVNNIDTMDEKMMKYILETPALSTHMTRKEVIMRGRKKIRRKKKKKNMLLLKIFVFIFVLIILLITGYRFFPDLYIGVIHAIIGS